MITDNGIPCTSNFILTQISYRLCTWFEKCERKNICMELSFCMLTTFRDKEISYRQNFIIIHAFIFVLFIILNVEFIQSSSMWMWTIRICVIFLWGESLIFKSLLSYEIFSSKQNIPFSWKLFLEPEMVEKCTLLYLLYVCLVYKFNIQKLVLKTGNCAPCCRCDKVCEGWWRWRMNWGIKERGHYTGYCIISASKMHF